MVRIKYEVRTSGVRVKKGNCSSDARERQREDPDKALNHPRSIFIFVCMWATYLLRAVPATAGGSLLRQGSLGHPVIFTSTG